MAEFWNPTGGQGRARATVTRRLCTIAGWASIGSKLPGADFGAMSNQEALAKIEDVGVIARVSPRAQGSQLSKC
jgi:hypothetical protein